MDNEPSMDQAFLEKLTEIVEENLDGEQFGVNDLAREAGMSRSQIHRKLQELTNQSTTQFIRKIRLIHAMKLLRNRVGTVSEIAYRVGFSSPTYFSTCFHEYYGFPPGEAAEHSMQETKEDTPPASKLETIHNLAVYSSIVFIVLLLFGGYYYLQNGGESSPKQIPSIAVLPLDNLTGDPDQLYYVEGLHDALIGELGQLSRLRVISRTSTLRFRNTKSDIRDIAEQLGVNNIIEGSVYRAGDSVRIQVQLIQVDTVEQHKWAQRYERDTRNILSMLSDVSREIAQNVEITLTPGEDSLLINRREVNPEAYKAYLRGQYYLNQYTAESYQKGIDYLLEATRIDPGDPLPWARLALGYNTVGHGNSPPPDAFDKAQAAAEKALKLDESLGEVQLALTLVDLYQEWDWKAAERGFNATLKYDPNIAEAHAHYSWYRMLSGASVDKVVEEQKLAIELDPFMSLYPTFLGFIYWYAGEYEKGIEALQESLSLNPDFAYAYYVLGCIYSDTDQFEKAVEAYQKASDLNPNWSYGLALAHAKAGHKEKARNLAEKMAVDPKPIETWGLAEVYTILGEPDEAFRWLNACYKVRFSWYPWIYWNPNFDPLKSDPRFDEHLKRIDPPVNSPLAFTFQ